MLDGESLIARIHGLIPQARRGRADMGGAAPGIPGALIAPPLVGSAKRIALEFSGTGETDTEGSPKLLHRLRSLLHRDKADASA